MESQKGMGKLLPKSLSGRRRQRGKKGQPGDGDTDAALDRPVSSGNMSLYANEHDDERERERETDHGDDGSFASYESSADASRSGESLHSSSHSRPVRPVPSNHPSQVGYLTTSSPAVQAAHLDSPPKIRSSSRSSRSPWRRGSKNEKVDPPPELPSSVKFPDLPVPAKLAVADRDTRGKPPRVEVDVPRTPPNGDKPSPVIVNTPPTPTDPGLNFHNASPDHPPSFAVRSPAESGSPTRNMSLHRRSKSGGAAIGPSKLSNITSAPLTPGSEGDGGALTPSATGFFSSVISAAQSAATTLSNNIPGTGIGIGGQKNKGTSSKSASMEAVDQPEEDTRPASQPNNEEAGPQTRIAPRSSAIQTLGTGELSLSQLGLSDIPSNAASPASARFPDVVDTRTRSESAPVEPHSELPSDEPISRPRSVIESTNGDDLVQSHMDITDAKFTPNRTSSVRSAMKQSRKRGSSVTTAANVPTGAPLQPTPTLGAPKLTGFAIASKKRNRDFHSFFKSVPDDDYLIEDYSCALQREILAHGRLYVSEGHLCFSSNILGWTTTLVMSFDEIVSVEKRSTALVFKNGLMISTLHAKHIFASFTSRDATYDLIVNIWKLGHPTLKSSLNGVQLEGTGGDKTEKVDDEPHGLGLENETPMGSESEDGSDDDEDEFYDEEEHDDFVDTQLTEVSGGADAENDKAVTRKVSTMTTLNGASADGAKEAPTSPPLGGDFPGPATHAPTECTDGSTHYDKVVGDDVIPAPLGKVYNLLFGSAAAAWMTKWLLEDQKCTELEVDDKKGLAMDNTTRTWSYIKPLYAALGPKQTKCIVTEVLEKLDYDKAISLTLSTRTPDVPNGTMFTVKTKYCLTWAENNGTRIHVNHTTEWSGKSWLKGPIEKGVNDGQAQYCKELFASVKAAVTTRARSGTLTNGGKGKKKGKKSRASLNANEASDVASKQAVASKVSWGPLEPVRSALEPVLDILKPVLTGNVMYGLLVGLLVASWFGFGFSPSKPAGGFGGGAGGRGEIMDLYGPFRLAAYEEMWRREESELWEWLEERTGLGQMDSDKHGIRKRAVEPRTLQERMRESKMDTREVQEAIRVTEEKLKVLRQVVVNNAKQEKGS